jgi:hypothetical protein
MQHPATRTDPDNQIRRRPIPTILGIKALEQGFTSGKELSLHVEEQ